jgi:protein-disulfide isomerase
MKTIRSIAATCAAIALLAAVMLVARDSTSRAAGGVTDQQIIVFLQKHFRLPSDRNIQLGPPTKSPFSKLMTRTVTISDSRGGKGKATIFTEPGVNEIIVGELLNLGSDPWGRIDLQSMHLKDRATLGPANAPITIVEFADFECPHCAYAMGVVDTAVESKYKGKIRLIFKNFPLQGHQWARSAAVAAECVRMQNPATFWDFARYIYSNQTSINPENLSQRIDEFAQRNQLDPETLHACMMGNAADAQIAQDVSDAQKAQVVSTPTLFVDGIRVLGAEPEVLDYVINSELKRQKLG